MAEVFGLATNAQSNRFLTPPVPGMPEQPPASAMELSDIMAKFAASSTHCSTGVPAFSVEILMAGLAWWFRNADWGGSERPLGGGQLDDPDRLYGEELEEEDLDCMG